MNSNNLDTDTDGDGDGSDKHSTQAVKNMKGRRRKRLYQGSSERSHGAKKRAMATDQDGTMGEIIVAPRPFGEINREEEEEEEEEKEEVAIPGSVRPLPSQQLDKMDSTCRDTELLLDQEVVCKATSNPPKEYGRHKDSSMYHETIIIDDGPSLQDGQKSHREGTRADEQIKFPTTVTGASEQQSHESAEACWKFNIQLERYVANSREQESALAVARLERARVAEERQAMIDALHHAREQVSQAEREMTWARGEANEKALRLSASLADCHSLTVALAEAEERHKKELDEAERRLRAKEAELSVNSDVLTEAQAMVSECLSQIEKLQQDKAGLEGRINELKNDGDRARAVAARTLADMEKGFYKTVERYNREKEAQALSIKRLARENERIISAFEAKIKARDEILEKQRADIETLQEKSSRLVAVEADLEEANQRVLRANELVEKCSLWQEDLSK
ncbi:hypothetical protein F5Y17DRAFT_475723 [Xylariaceae sp. FL0594]|nr:hypothetical protein F5Y17DRAFT_475723 [Xylariaceae sp. FL0594]